MLSLGLRVSPGRGVQRHDHVALAFRRTVGKLDRPLKRLEEISVGRSGDRQRPPAEHFMGHGDKQSAVDPPRVGDDHRTHLLEQEPELS